MWSMSRKPALLLGHNSLTGKESGIDMEPAPRLVYIQTLTAKLQLHELEYSSLRRELVTPFVTTERRAAIRERIDALIRIQKRIEAKLEWARAEERLCLARNSQSDSRKFGS
jgi:hypothetical protein